MVMVAVVIVVVVRAGGDDDWYAGEEEEADKLAEAQAIASQKPQRRDAIIGQDLIPPRPEGEVGGSLS